MAFDFDKNKIAIKCIYKSDTLVNYKNMPLHSEKVNTIYGMPLKFKDTPKDRPFTYASYVESMDGKLAYADDPDAFYVAQKNEMAEYGKTTDYWILNLLRATADAALIGGNTLHIDENYCMITEDPELQESRMKENYNEFPLQVISSLDALDIPMNHQLMHQMDIPRIVSTSLKGWETFEANYPGKLHRVNYNDLVNIYEDTKQEALYVLVTGESSYPNTKEVMWFLKNNKINNLLIESPGFGHHLIQEQMLDEIFFNFSCVYIGGGDTMTLGKASKGFSAHSHPHARVLSLHNYNDFYFYFRYRMEYDMVGKQHD